MQLGAPGLTPQQVTCLELYAAKGYFGAGLVQAGATAADLREWKTQSAFQDGMALAQEIHADLVRGEIHRRAVVGWEEPVYQKGGIVGYVRRYSDRLLELYAKMLMPEFRDQYKSDVTVSGGLVFTPWIDDNAGAPSATLLPAPSAEGSVASTRTDDAAAD